MLEKILIVIVIWLYITVDMIVNRILYSELKENQKSLMQIEKLLENEKKE